jgi:hypothetical protein
MAKKRFRGIILTIISFIALILPLLILMIWRKNQWFALKIDTTKVSIGFIIALVFALCLLKGAFKDLDKRFTTIFTLCSVALITWLLESIMSDITIILIAAIIGYSLYLIINSIGKKDLNYVKEYNNEKARVDARTEARSLDGSV